MGSTSQGRFREALLFQEAFLVQLCSPAPQKLFTLAQCQAGTGVRVCGRVRAFAPAPYSSQSHFAERRGPCEDERAGLLARIPMPGAGLGHHAYVWGQWVDFWMSGLVPRVGLSPPHAQRPRQAARPGLGEWEGQPRTRPDHGGSWWTELHGEGGLGVSPLPGLVACGLGYPWPSEPQLPSL